MVTFKIEIDEGRQFCEAEGTGTNECFLKAAGLIFAQRMEKYAKDNHITEVPIEFLDFCLRETKDITKKICERDGVSVANKDYVQFGEHVYGILSRGSAKLRFPAELIETLRGETEEDET